MRDSEKTTVDYKGVAYGKEGNKNTTGTEIGVCD